MTIKKGLGLLTKLGHLWLKRNILRAIVLSLLITIIQIFIIIYFFSQLPPQVPLFYSRPWGQAQLAEPQNLFLLPGFSFLILLINSLLAASFADHQDFYSYCLTWVSTIFSAFSLITLIKIIQIII